MTVRVRFAPSPTGHLHIGGARTALYNWLYARRLGGTFILRIEDTDAERSTPEATQAILDGLKWLGMDWDEGPFYQSQRTALYREHAEKLLQAGLAYRCYCTAEELEAKRKAAVAAGRSDIGYDGTCRHRTAPPAPGAPFTVRIKQPRDGGIVLDDLVKGRVEKQNIELDDLILLRSDGSPTYNFCVVIDDGTMGITHVIRGDDHLNNTFRQWAIFEALGFPKPKFAHLPLILGQDRAKLSKRHAATSVVEYQEQGFVAEALVNFLARIGWSHGDQEVFTRDELIQMFALEEVSISAGVWNAEKLLWLGQVWLKQLPEDEVGRRLVPFLAKRGVAADPADPRLPGIARTLRERAHTLGEMADGALFYFRAPAEFEAKAREKFLVAASRPVFAALADTVRALEPWEPAAIETALRATAEKLGLGMGKVAQPLRVALTGVTTSPPIHDVAHLVGRDETLRRVEAAAAACPE